MWVGAMIPQPMIAARIFLGMSETLFAGVKRQN
jgi:hypothetical protein